MSPAGLPDAPTNAMVRSPSWEAAMPTWARSVTVETRLLVVSYVRPADDYVSLLRNHAGTMPEEFVVVEARPDATARNRDYIDVRTEDPERLTGVGLQTNELLTRWRDLDEPTIVVLDSVTGLLQYVELDVAYRFLHPFTAQVRLAGACGFYRFADAAHDQLTISTLEQLFDTFIRAESASEEYQVQSSAFG